MKNRSQDAHALALPDLVEKCLNHTEPNKLKRIDLCASFEAPMRDAWRLLGDRLHLLHMRATGKVTNVVRGQFGVAVA